MCQLVHFATSIEDVLVIMGFAAALVVLFTRRIRRDRCIATIGQLLAGEDGASYAVSVAISIPFYCLMVATVVECALLMQVKAGTMYAAFTAARAAAVWLPAEVSSQRREEMVKLAAAQALAPFASSKPIHLEPTGARLDDVDGGDRAYWEAYLAYCGGRAPCDYWARKRQYAMAATAVTIYALEPEQSEQYAPAVRVKVVYEKPVDLPVVGAFLGRRASWPGARFFSRKIESEWVIQLETPKSTFHTLGICYDSWDY